MDNSGFAPGGEPPKEVGDAHTQRKAKKKAAKKKKAQRQEREQQQQQQQQQQEKATAESAAAVPAPLNPAAASFEPSTFSAINDPSPPPALTTSSSSSSSSSAAPAVSPPQQQMAATICRLQSCSKTTSPNDGATVACPACGVDSLIRYCSKEHLYDDVREHYLNHCRRYTISSLSDELTAPLKSRQHRPYLFNKINTNIGTIEHHRQAVYFAMEPEDEGDYFIFADVAVLGSVAMPTMQQLSNCRGTGKLVARIKIAETDDEYDSRKQRLRWLVARCLLRGATDNDGTRDCIDLAMMIRQQLINEEKWDEDMITYLVMGMKQEFAIQLPVEMMQ